MHARKLICVLLTTAGLGALATPAAHGAVVINEVNCEGTDWVELVNTSDEVADVSGWLLTDDPIASNRADHRMFFGAGTSVPALGDLVVERGASGFPFGISCGGDTLRLANGVPSVVDEVSIPEIEPEGDTWGRYPSGTGDWIQTVPTAGAPNEPSTAAGDPSADPAAWLFDPASVVEIELTAPQSSLDAMAEATWDQQVDYQPATFSLTTVGGTYGPFDVGLRPKGGLGSFRPLTGKTAWKLKFNEFVPGQRFLGLEKLTLNNMVQDPSMLRELLSYELFRATGIPAPRTGYAFVSLNGMDYGVYLNVETYDEASLPRWFATTRHLYEAHPGLDVVDGFLDAFEVDEGSEQDRTDLEALIAVSSEDSQRWLKGMRGVADMEQMTRMWAGERYTGQMDGYVETSNNYYLHSDSAGIFRMLPWGTDNSWHYPWGFSDPGRGELWNRCRDEPACFDLYREGVSHVHQTAAGLDLDGLAARTADMLAPWQAADPRRESTAADTTHWVTITRAFIAERSAMAADWLAETAAAPPPGPARPPETWIGRVRKTAGVHRFTFGSRSHGATLQCRIDRAAFRRCASPLVVRAGRGRHTFSVRATMGGLVDSTPARARFTVAGR